MILNIPLALLQLTRQRLRFIVALAGIAFVVILIFMQLGFQDALYTSATHVHRNLRGDLILISSQYKFLTSQQSFPRSRLYQALGFNGVEAISPLYLEYAVLKNPQNGQKNSILILGFDLAKLVFNLSEVNQNINKIKFPDVILFDRASRLEFGPIANKFEQEKSVDFEISGYKEETGYRVKVGGLFTLGPSFGADGNLIMNYLTFLRAFQNRQVENIDIGLITLKPSADIQKVRLNLQSNLPKDIKVLTKQEFIDLEKHFWAVRTPIGFLFNLSVTMGFVIGTAIVYQILYSNISNHLIEYATLKAMGFTNKYLLSVVFQQALVLAILGYIPGFTICLGLYDLANNATHLPISMGIDKALMVLTSAVLMCLMSATIAIGKLHSADPSDIF